MSRRLLTSSVLAVVALAGVLFGVHRFSGASTAQSLRVARGALESGYYADAAARAENVLAKQESKEARLIAGEAAIQLKRYDDALRHYLAVPDDGTEESVKAIYWSGEIYLERREIARALECFAGVIQHRPNDAAAREQLAAVLGLFGRRWESAPHLLELVRQRRFGVDQLLFLGDTEFALLPPEDIQQYVRQAPDDPHPYLSLARHALEREKHPESALRLARTAVERGPRLMEAWAVLGRTLLEFAPEELRAWHAKLPKEAEAHPDVWLVRGLSSQQLGREDAAVRSFWEAVRRAPNHRAANHHLGRALVALGESDKAAPFLERSEQLQELRDAFNLIYQILVLQQDGSANPKSIGLVSDAARLTEALGRLWEARAWCQIALQLDPDLSWAQIAIGRIEPQLSDDLPQTIPSGNPANRIDLSSYPLLDPSDSSPPRDPQIAVTAENDHIQFEDATAAAGIDFQYWNGIDSSSPGKLLALTMGGGVAVLDYDSDGWPDLYFPQGAPWQSEADPQSFDRCFRNLGNGRFADVTLPAGLGDLGYSHGATMGDVDNDGFPDLYVANLGRNSLYRNNGDGTFADITGQAGIRHERWTTSCVMADLNGDSWPDLYDVNYLTGEHVHSITCPSKGRVRACAPALFPGEQDAFLLSRGDGTFDDRTEEAGFTAADGKGLGAVAADVTLSGRLNLYVANDSVANFYFVNETESPGSAPRFRESAVLAGLAFDAEGRALGSMGIALDDANADGVPDLFVSNYVEEYNNLYVQRRGGYFEDLGRRSGVADSGYRLVGFGAQFLDADLDGRPDLVLANGHISDDSDQGYLYRMPPQFFYNAGEGRLAELPANALGTYFEGTHLGRGLGRLDWNRDGREDFVVSHLDSPAALLTNTTQSSGRSLTLRFAATQGSRDAIGTTVTLTAAGRTSVRQLTAGDGYMASNQRELVFGLGDSSEAESIAVRWPSGHEARLTAIEAGQQLLLIEGRADPLRLR